MNQTQKRYAIERVNDILKQKKNALRDKHTKERIELTSKEMISKIRYKHVALLPYSEIDFSKYRYNLREIFDFTSFEKVGGLNTESYDKERNPIEKKAQEIKDKIMLGNAEEALKMIQEFEKIS